MNAENISLFASTASWIEGESLRQLERVASLPGMARVAGFPDLHPGKGSPVGAAMLSKGAFYPYLVGSDVGCGMGLFATDLSVAKAKPEKWSQKLHDLEVPWDGDTAAWLEERGVRADDFDGSVGTIGGGNHFAELLRQREVHDPEAFKALGLDESELVLLVHSGSRGLGEALLRSHTDRFRDGSLAAGSEEAAAYLARHANAMAWSTANRELIAHRLVEQLGSDYRTVTDLTHNSVTTLTIDGEQSFLHRKGAAPSDTGPVVIPGSRGAASYLVMPAGDQERNLWSVAHGAGRKWNRSECAGRLRKRYSADALRKTGLGSYVICEDKELLYEEAPQAYKDIEAIIGDLVSFGLIKVIASFTPVLTYKVRER
jgi:release factor H-coupled RctB family protein